MTGLKQFRFVFKLSSLPSQLRLISLIKTVIMSPFARIRAVGGMLLKKFKARTGSAGYCHDHIKNNFNQNNVYVLENPLIHIGAFSLVGCAAGVIWEAKLILRDIAGDRKPGLM